MFSKKTIIISVVVFLVLAGLFLKGCMSGKKETGYASFTFYGLENSDVYAPIIAKYKESHPNVTIKYKKFNDPVEYENLLVNEMAEGKGPDIFYVHNTWLPRHSKKITPLDSTVLTPQNITDTYVSVVANDFVQPDSADGIKKIYALPLYVDTLGLYYNKSDFESKIPERGKPAPTWDGIKGDADKLRMENSTTKALEHGEIALGRADNIRYAADILYNFFLQSGVDFYNSNFKQVQFAAKGKEMFNYFTSFAVPLNKNFSWDTALTTGAQLTAPELEAFLSGKVSSILAYSDLYPRLETELKNVKSRASSVIDLKDIAVTKIPQMSENEGDFKVWADYYGVAVSRNCLSPKTAWDFVQFLTSTENARIFHKVTKRPTARRDLIEEQKKEPITDVFVSQLGYASSYRIFSDQKFADVLKEAVNSVNTGMDGSSAISEAEAKINAILKTEAPDGLYPPVKVVK